MIAHPLRIASVLLAAAALAPAPTEAVNCSKKAKANSFQCQQAAGISNALASKKRLMEPTAHPDAIAPLGSLPVTQPLLALVPAEQPTEVAVAEPPLPMLVPMAVLQPRPAVPTVTPNLVPTATPQPAPDVPTAVPPLPPQTQPTQVVVAQPPTVIGGTREPVVGQQGSFVGGTGQPTQVVVAQPPPPVPMLVPMAVPQTRLAVPTATPNRVPTATPQAAPALPTAVPPLPPQMQVAVAGESGVRGAAVGAVVATSAATGTTVGAAWPAAATGADAGTQVEIYRGRYAGVVGLEAAPATASPGEFNLVVVGIRAPVYAR